MAFVSNFHGVLSFNISIFTTVYIIYIKKLHNGNTGCALVATVSTSFSPTPLLCSKSPTHSMLFRAPN